MNKKNNTWGPCIKISHQFIVSVNYVKAMSSVSVLKSLSQFNLLPFL